MAAMSVLHVVPSVAPRYGGPTTAVLAMCRALAAGGIESAIATTDADGPGRLPVALERFEIFEGVPTIFFRRQASEAFKYSGPLAGWLDGNVRRFDLVHVHAVFSHASLAAAAACRRRDVPYVVRPLGTLTPWSLSQKPTRKRVAWRVAASRMMRRAAAVHYTSVEEQRATETALGLTGGVVIGLGVDEALLADEPFTGHVRDGVRHDAVDPYVLLLSRLHPVKGLELALEALLEVLRQDRFAAWRVMVGGDGEPEYVSRLKDLVVRAGGRDRVTFSGWLDGSEKIDALRRASLFLLASRHESFGLSVLEALACGVPVVVSPHVGLAEDVRAAGAGWVAELEHDALVNTIGMALEHDWQREARGTAGRALVRDRFTWTGIATQLVRLYQSVLALSGRRRRDTC